MQIYLNKDTKLLNRNTDIWTKIAKSLNRRCTHAVLFNLVYTLILPKSTLDQMEESLCMAMESISEELESLCMAMEGVWGNWKLDMGDPRAEQQSICCGHPCAGSMY